MLPSILDRITEPGEQGINGQLPMVPNRKSGPESMCPNGKLELNVSY